MATYERLTDTTYRVTGEAREYFKDDDPLPYPSFTSVTRKWASIRGLLGYATRFQDLEDMEDDLNEKGDFGTAVHDEIQQRLQSAVFYDEYKDFPNPDPYVLSALKYVKDEELYIVPEQVEITVFNENPRFAGTIDLLTDRVTDWKTSANPSPTHLIQVAAGMKAAERDSGQVVYLNASTRKTYSIRNVKWPRDWERFEACLPQWWKMHRRDLVDIEYTYRFRLKPEDKL